MTGSAPISAETRAFVESFLDLHLVDPYGSTEDGVVTVDAQTALPKAGSDADHRAWAVNR
jgi:fatty acid CoA ligase FadD9